jgi:hypothetical protein
LPARAQICQFCKADVSKVARPAVAGPAPVAIADSNWKTVAYFVMAGWWIFNGIIMILGAIAFHNKLMEGGAAMFDSIPIAVIVIGFVYALTGIGLALRVEIARGIVNVLSWISVGFALMRIAGLLFAGLVMGPIVILWMLRAVVDGLLAGFQIYLIGETDNFMR